MIQDMWPTPRWDRAFWNDHSMAHVAVNVESPKAPGSPPEPSNPLEAFRSPALLHCTPASLSLRISENFQGGLEGEWPRDRETETTGDLGRGGERETQESGRETREGKEWVGRVMDWKREENYE